MKQNTLKEILMPILGMLIIIGIFIVSILFLSYVFIFGAIIWIALFIFAWLRSLYLRYKLKQASLHSPHKQPSSGRIFDHEDPN